MNCVGVKAASRRKVKHFSPCPSLADRMPCMPHLYSILEQLALSASSAAVAAIVKAREFESDDRSPLVSGSNPVAATFAFANLRKKFRRVQNHNQEW